MQAAKRTPVDLRAWAVSLLERHNRKSHLAPQLSPSTQELLRGDSESPITAPSSSQPTPTNGDSSVSNPNSSDPRSLMNPPRDREREQIINTINGSRPQMKANSSIGRSGGANFHPGLGRITATNSIPQVQQVETPIERASSATATTFSHSLPIRPAPPAGPLPPPPVPRKEEPRERKQATYPPQSGGYVGGYQRDYRDYERERSHGGY